MGNTVQAITPRVIYVINYINYDVCVCDRLQVQLMSGVSRAIYFGTNFIFDGILMMASTLAMLATILLYNPLDSFTVFNDTWGKMI